MGGDEKRVGRPHLCDHLGEQRGIELREDDHLAAGQQGVGGEPERGRVIQRGHDDVAVAALEAPLLGLLGGPCRGLGLTE